VVNLEDALHDANDFLEDLHIENGYKELGDITWFYRDALRYVIKYAETMKATPTTHDSKAEMDDWDLFFEERKAAVIAKRSNEAEALANGQD
jgi:hypothetical protein